MKKIVYFGLDVDDTQYHGSALNKECGELLSFRCRPTLKGLLGQLVKVRKASLMGRFIAGSGAEGDFMGGRDSGNTRRLDAGDALQGLGVDGLASGSSSASGCVLVFFLWSRLPVWLDQAFFPGGLFAVDRHGIQR